MANYRLRIGFPSGYVLTAAQGSYVLTGISAGLTYSVPSGAITPSLVATRSSGPAPFAALYDATATTVSGLTSDEVFRKCTFLFEVQQGGTTVSGTYANGRPRYSQSGGPVASFNMITPGSYTIKLTVTKGIPWAAPAANESAYNYVVGDIVTNAGNTYTCATAHAASASIVPGSHVNWTFSSSGFIQSSTSVAATSDDPDVTFAGTATVCINNAGTSDGLGPVGCTYASSVGTPVSNKRYLFKKGQSFSGSVFAQFGTSNIYFGSYGTGAQPQIDTISGATSNSLSTFPHTIVVSGIDMKKTAWSESPKRITLYNNTLTRDAGLGNDSLIDMGSQGGTYFDSGSYSGNKNLIVWGVENFLFENTATGVISGGDPGNPDHPNLTVMGYYMKSAIVANSFDYADEFSLRMFGTAKAFVGHNTLGGHCKFDKGALKIHSSGNTMTYSDFIVSSGSHFPGGSLGATGGMASMQVVFADNIVGTPSSNNIWQTGIGPQNLDSPTQDFAGNPYGTVEFHKDFIFERNTFYRGGNTQQDLHNLGSNFTVRGNSAPQGTFDGDNVHNDEYPAPDDSVSFDYGRRLMPTNCGPYYGQLT